MVTGAQPTLPLDVLEATWLVTVPGRILTTVELVGYHAKALAKHQQHVAEMRTRVDKSKKEWLERYKKTIEYLLRTLPFNLEIWYWLGIAKWSHCWIKR